MVAKMSRRDVAPVTVWCELLLMCAVSREGAWISSYDDDGQHKTGDRSEQSHEPW